MSNVYICADLHLGHKNITKYRNFATPEEHDKYIIDRINSTITARDVLYLPGDVFFDIAALHNFKNKTHGNIKIIPGNHDDKAVIAEMTKHFFVYGPHKYKKHWITHIPMHPSELRGKPNIHGHVHTNTIENDYRYFNVSMENISYTPIRFDIVRDLIESKNYDTMSPITTHL